MGNVAAPKLPLLIRDEFDAIADFAARIQVQRLYRFGSAVRDVIQHDPPTLQKQPRSLMEQHQP